VFSRTFLTGLIFFPSAKGILFYLQCYTAMPIFLIEWLLTQGRFSPEVFIIFPTAARYRRATVEAAMITRARMIRRYARGQFATTPAL
jgi:hypothetical protein